MATRHLRRLQEQASKQSTGGIVGDVDEDHEDEDIAAESKKAPFNPFDLLSDDEDAAGVSDPEDTPGVEGAAGTAAGEAEAEENEEQEQQQEQQAKAKPKTPSKQKAAKKKKKKGKAGGKQADADSDEDAKPKPGKAAAAAAKGVEDDIEAIVRELNLTTVGSAAISAAAGSSSSSGAAAGAKGPASTAAAGAAAGAPSSASVLCVDVKGLRGDEELRRIFGSDVVAAVDRQDRATAAEARRTGAAARGLPGRRRGLALKRGWLVAPKENWPACEGGLSMELTGNKAGVPTFRYVFSPAYRETQARFLRCQASYDPATIAALLQQAPYHVDSLLAMHDLYRHMGENSYAEEMLDRALWMLESAWHPSFQPAIAACRLDYGVEENRALFGALFRHVQALSRRGCHRAALECCKLLLALEPEDPMGGMCLLDYLAVRAGRYDWLQRFVLQFEGNRSLALLPNYAFALPMAAHRQQQEQQRQPSAAPAAGGWAAERAQPGASSSGSTAADAASPHELLVGALLLHPLVLPRLVAKLQDKGAAKESYWKELLSRRLFSGSSDGGSASLSHLVGLYVERSGELWKPPDLLSLLRRAAEEAADVADGKMAPANGIGAADWRAVAAESFPASASNEYRHLRLADFSDAVNALPREEVEAAVQGGGAMQDVEEALAELQEQMILAAQERQQQQQPNGGAAAAAPMTDEQLRGANPLLMLLRSLLPWVNAGQQPNYAAEGTAGAGAAAAAGAGGAAPPPQPPLEYDENDGHLDDEEGVVRQVRR